MYAFGFLNRMFGLNSSGFEAKQAKGRSSLRQRSCISVRQAKPDFSINLKGS